MQMLLADIGFSNDTWAFFFLQNFQLSKRFIGFKIVKYHFHGRTSTISSVTLRFVLKIKTLKTLHDFARAEVGRRRQKNLHLEKSIIMRGSLFEVELFWKLITTE